MKDIERDFEIELRALDCGSVQFYRVRVSTQRNGNDNEEEGPTVVENRNHSRIHTSRLEFKTRPVLPSSETGTKNCQWVEPDRWYRPVPGGIGTDPIERIWSGVGAVSGPVPLGSPSVLGGLGIYYLSLFVMPVAIAKKLESIRATFFWSGTETVKKMAWIKWDQVLAKKEKGGLDIGSLVSFNLALVLKWKWRFFQCPDSLWVRFLKIVYGENGSFFNGRCVAVGASPWSRVVAANRKLHVTGVISEDTLKRKVGNGRATRFWEDCWVGDRPLAITFPRLVALEVDRRCTVADRWGTDGWCWVWQRTISEGRSLAALHSMGRLLGEVQITENEDTWQWNIGSNGVFSVAETRRRIDDMVNSVEL
ncbi:hypothetical protein LXL04_032010 [Taraxacum kok-saghyz]